MMLTSHYVQVHNDAYYVAGTRIGLDVVIQEFRDGRSPEEIFEAYPSIGSLSRVYGTITFILEHPAEVDSYLKAQDPDGTPDPDVLRIAAEAGRVLVLRDVSTMPGHFEQFMRRRGLQGSSSSIHNGRSGA